MDPFNLQKCRLRGEYIAVYKIANARMQGTQSTLFFTVHSDVTRGNRYNLGNRKFQLDLRKKIITRVVKHWKMLLREAVKSSYLEVYKTRLGTALSKQVLLRPDLNRVLG